MRNNLFHHFINDHKMPSFFPICTLFMIVSI
uniref:Uncharacterized protein n=1 Tax=Anguilla anguilla TaxID=7936 RepID=A0A0E9UWT9_ANGAN